MLPQPLPEVEPPYHVILLDDDDHTYEYVIQMLKAIFGYPEEKGYEMAKKVDSDGRVIVATVHKELAELRQEQIQTFICQFNQHFTTFASEFLLHVFFSGCKEQNSA